MNNETDKIHDCVFYWDGGTERGRWLAAATSKECPTLGEVERSIRRQGFYTVRGLSRVGPPDGPPKRLREFWTACHPGQPDEARMGL